MHGLRPQYQERINFVILDYDIDEDFDFAQEMGIAAHPAFGVIPPDGAPDTIEHRAFGPLNEGALRELLDAAIARYGS